MPSWNWGEEQSSSGVVHQSVTNTDNNDSTVLKQGYDYANFSEISPTPTHCWPQHEDSGSTVYDLAGTSDGTTNGGVTQSATGLLGTTAYSYDATDDYVSLPAGVVSTGTDYTFCVWYQYDGTDSWILELRDNFRLILNVGRASSGELGMRVADGGAANDFGFGVFPNTGVWNQVVLVYDDSATEWTVYHNGSQVFNQVTDAADDPNNSNAISSPNTPWGGKIADTRIYQNTLLSQSQAQALYDVVATQGTWTGTQKLL